MTESQHDDTANPAPIATEASVTANAGDSRTAADWLRPIVIYAAALITAVIFLYSIYTLARPLAILLASIIIAVAMEPIVARLERRLPRGLATVLVYLVVVLILISIGFIIGWLVRDDAMTLYEEFPRNQQEVEALISEYAPGNETAIVDFARDQAGRFSDLIVSLPFTLVSTVVDIVLALFLSLYWVIAAPSLRRFVLSLFPAGDQRERADQVITSVGETMGGYVRAEVIDGTIIGVLTFIGLTLLDVRFAVPLAVFAAFMELIPVIGPIVSAVPAILIALVDSPTKALLVLGFYVLLQQLESNVLMPNIMESQTRVPPLLSLFAVFAGGSIAAILGALIAVPISGALMVLVQMVIAPAIRDRYGGG